MNLNREIDIDDWALAKKPKVWVKLNPLPPPNKTLTCDFEDEGEEACPR